MITALVQFKLPQPLTREKAQQLFVGTAPKYRETSALIRKYLPPLRGWRNGGWSLLVEIEKKTLRLFIPRSG